MIGLKLSIDKAGFLEQIKKTELEESQKALFMLEAVGLETIAFLRSLTSEMRPPRRPGESPRPAHPGHWADVTSNLANAYRFELWAGGARVRWVPESEKYDKNTRGKVRGVTVNGSMPANPTPPFQLILINGMEYAAALEAREGYFVLSEVTEDNGPVVNSLRQAARALGWDVRI